MESDVSAEPSLDPVIFAFGQSWRERLSNWLAKANNSFLNASGDLIKQTLSNTTSGARFVVNIPADALLAFLRNGTYKNAYDQPVVAGMKRGPSPTRIKVDALLELSSPCASYFGAVALNGAGMRFYGEYCLVLERNSVDPATVIIDRNSYDLVREPLVSVASSARIVSTLKGTWDSDLAFLLQLKILPRLTGFHFLATTGTISELVLHDEEYVEAIRDGTFSPTDVEEIRTFVEDDVLLNSMAERYRGGHPPTIDEMIWADRRSEIERELWKRGKISRPVLSSGRSGRWSS